MAKTYTALTVANATAGNAILASDFSSLFTNSNNYRVPPSCCVRRTSDLSYTGNSDITWNDAGWDTDGMWAAGSPTIITVNTAGLYMVTFVGRCTNASMTDFTPYVMLNTTSVMGTNIDVSTGYFCFSAVINITAGQTLKARIFVNAGGSDPRQIEGSATDQFDEQTRLVAHWLGQAS